ncbi:hypothetical protein ACOMHN_052708 [Nucella lapillus]
MGGQPSDAPALSPPSPLQQGGQSSNAPALSPPSPLPQGGQPIALALSPSSPLPQDGQPSDAPGLSPSSSTLLLCPSDSTLSICHLNSQSAVKTDEQKEVQQPGDSGPTEDSGVFNVDHNFNYDAIDDDWYYDPDKKETAELIKTTPSSTVSTRDSSQQVKSANTNVSLPESKMEMGGGKLEGAVSKDEAPKKKVLQAPKRTIILYTAVILILIACIVLFSVWKKPFQDGRPMHQPTIVRSGEEGKRLLDHPFV